MLYRYLPKYTATVSAVAPPRTILSSGITQPLAAGQPNDYSKVAVYGYVSSTQTYKINVYDTVTGSVTVGSANLSNANHTFNTLAYTADGLCRKISFVQNTGRNQIFSDTGVSLEVGPGQGEMDGINSSTFGLVENGRPGSTGSIVAVTRLLTANGNVRDNLLTSRISLPAAYYCQSVCYYSTNRAIVFYSPNTVGESSQSASYAIYNTSNWQQISTGVLSTTRSAIRAYALSSNRIVIVLNNTSPSAHIGLYAISDSGISLIGANLPVVRSYPNYSNFGNPSVAIKLGPNKDHLYYDSGQYINNNRDKVYGTSSMDESTDASPLSGLIKVTDEGLVARKISINYGQGGNQITQSQIAFSAPNGDLIIAGAQIARFDFSSVV